MNINFHFASEVPKVKQSNFIIVEVFIAFKNGFEFYEILKVAPTQSPNVSILISVLPGFRSQKPKIGSSIERNIGNSLGSRI